MKLFNFNRATSQPNRQTSTAEANSAWDTLRTQPSQPENTPDAEHLAADKARQERKAIGIILYGNQVITQPDLQVSEQDRERALQALGNGEFDSTKQSAALQHIVPPSRAHGDHREAVFAKLGDKHSRRIFAFVNDIPDIPENLRDLSSTMIDTTLSRYPTPIEFNTKAAEMLQCLRAKNPEAKCQEYAHDLETFKQELYGKRQEYYAIFQSLEQQAKQHQTKQSSRDRVLEAIHRADKQPAQATNTDPADQFAYPKDDLGYQAPEARERWRLPTSKHSAPASINQAPKTPNRSNEALRRPPQPVEVYHISPKEAERYLRDGQIDGDPFIQNGTSYQLTPEYLKSAGLGPEYVFKLNEQADIALSKVYKAQNHDAVTAYVRTKTGTQIVSYYRSNSQGNWRYLPDYVAPDTSDGSSIEWFGKGYSEESLNLPATTQQALEIISAQPHLQNNQLHSTFAFAGTAKRYADKIAHRLASQHGALRGRHYQEVASTPDLDLGQNSPHKQPPETLTITNPSITPNFQKLDSSYRFQSDIYGPVTSEHYRSQDGRLTWTFNRDISGRAWVGGIEVDSPISSAGLHTKWAQTGDYGTPLYEYSTQDGGYGDHFDRKGSQYVNMWKGYLSRMPIIQQYLTHKSQTRQ